ncbi:MAG: GntR family transcriptional regulator [Betaproteobacteria bacterium RIFCSPLOWO2_12_FULL_67_28]|nr:MAG: GntR family transcriptional regulator [Betaproteobacteria bacterium RIFCSPLOWO2_02_FULL_68_150]OGA68361.1 MAG: GntR family transcriptional regulator [Betaproteobacteria bacterium RIFCSPLOWO2_12_FULL_67_28]
MSGRKPGRNRNPLAQSVYERIKSDIFEFRLLPEARFSENEIARRARVSRTPVREALFRLQREGYLEVSAKSGWRVRPLDFDALDHLYDLRVILETAAIERLCAGEPKASLAALAKVWLVGPRRRLTDGAQVARLDEEFHGTLIAATGNPELDRIHREITERIRIVRRLDFTHPERIIYTYLEHAQILRAILARKAARAAALLKTHIGASKREVRKISLHRLHLAHLDARSGG